MSARRRWLRALLLLVVAVFFVEVASGLAYRLMEGEFPNRRTIAARMDELAQRSAAPENQAGDRVQYMRDRWYAALHPYLGFVLDPEECRRLDATRGMTVNDWGFRDAASPLRRRAPGKVVVAIAGGSVAQGIFLGHRDAIEAELRRSPRFAGLEFDWVDLAIDGFKQPQQLLSLTWLLSVGAEFDVVLAIDGFNDVALHAMENGPAGVHPSYPRNWATFVGLLSDGELIAAKARVDALQGERAAWAGRFAGLGPLRASWSLEFLWRFGDRRIENRIEEERRRQRERRRSHDFEAHGPKFEAADDADATLRELVRTWQRSSAQMDALCRANGARFVQILQPNQYDLDSKPFSEEERTRFVRATQPCRESVERGYPLLRAAGRALGASGVTFLDESGVFRDVTETAYCDDLCHLNATGGEKLARAIGAAVRAVLDAP